MEKETWGLRDQGNWLQLQVGSSGPEDVGQDLNGIFYRIQPQLPPGLPNSLPLFLS